MLRGLMMDRPLLITSILKHAAANHSESTVTSRFLAEPLHRYTYADAWRRAQQLANVLTALGVESGERVGTIAWNDHRHFELYYAVPGIGAVCHTINPRLAPEQLSYIINHAGDRWLFVDPMFLPLVERIWTTLTTVRGIIVMASTAAMPATTLPNVPCYETLMSKASAEFDWPEMDENTAAGLCYTSGTTGNPKGVLFTHRSTVLHALGCFTIPGCALKDDDTVLVVVPLFHASAWGYPHVAPIAGANLVLPGPKLDGASLHALMESEQVTISSGVPTLWLALLNHLRATGARLSTLKTLTSGGSALPRRMLEEFEETYGVRMFQGWGMTEMSPTGTFSSPTPRIRTLTVEEQRAAKLKAGRSIFGVELKIIDGEGNALPWDGRAQGELVVRGPWVASGYFNDAAQSAAALTADGWFRTGDVAVIDALGYVTIVDRTKDIIKSGGEWISSAILEHHALSHAEVSEAAVIGVPHAKWQERPLLLVVPKPGANLNKPDLLRHLATQVPRWWLPDDIVVVARFPYTATGKIQKMTLRKQYAQFALPTADAAPS